MSLITDLPFLQSFKPHYIHSRPPDVIKFTYSTVRYGKHPAYLRVASKDRLLPVFYLYDSYRCLTSFDHICPIHALVLFIDSSVSVVVSGLALPESKGRWELLWQDFRSKIVQLSRLKIWERCWGWDWWESWQDCGETVEPTLLKIRRPERERNPGKRERNPGMILISSFGDLLKKPPF